MQFRTRVARQAWALSGVALIVSLAGCGGGGMSALVPDSSTTSRIGNLMAFGSTTAPPIAHPANKVADSDIDCPPIEVLDGTSSLRTYAGGQSNADVRYQFSLGDLARECRLSDGQLSIKVGIEGRVVIGPKGTPGSFAAPLRIAIRRETDHAAAASKFFKIPVTIPPGATEAPFSLVADPIMVPFLRAEADQDYTVVVGFDSGGGTTEKVVRRRRPPKG